MTRSAVKPVQKPIQTERLFFLCLGASLLLHIFSGIYSIGFYDFDEQFQILEFLNYHLGRSGSAELAWEFQSQIRSWSQPILYEGLVRICMWFKIQDPAIWAIWIRLFSSILGWSSLVGLLACCRQWFKESGYRLAILFCSFLWCFPYLHARTTGENLAGTAFCWGVTLFFLLKNRYPRIRFVLTGILFGLSFDFRFQMAIAIAAFGLWLCFYGKRSISNILLLILGFSLSVILGFFLDSWVYQNWVFTPYQYFYKNILLGTASSFGRNPWYFYFTDIFSAYPPLGALTLLSIMSAWCFYPGHLLTWITGAFWIGHSLIEHKEERFLYPLVPLVPFLLVLTWEKLDLSRQIFQSKWLKLLFIPILVCNGVILVGSAFKASCSHPSFYAAVFRQNPPVRELYYIGKNPYELGGNIVHFYRSPELQLKQASSFLDLKNQVSNQAEFWLFYPVSELPKEEPDFQKSCNLVYTNFPSWLKYFEFLPGPKKFVNRWSLFQCRVSLIPVSTGKIGSN